MTKLGMVTFGEEACYGVSNAMYIAQKRRATCQRQVSFCRYSWRGIGSAKIRLLVYNS